MQLSLTVNSSDYVRLLVEKGGYIEFQKGVPYSSQKFDTIIVKFLDCSELEMLRETFDDLLGQSYIQQEGFE